MNRPTRLQSVIPELGLWIDDHPRVVLEPAYWDDLQEIGVSVAALMIDSPRIPWDPRWNVTQVEQACQLARDHDIAVVLTVWLSPQVEVIGAMIRDLSELLRAGPVGLENDTEVLWTDDDPSDGLWTNHAVRGFDNLDQAGAYALEREREICEPLDVRIEITTHSGHVEAGEYAHLTSHVDRLNLQLYGVRTRFGRPVGWNDREGPCHIQERGIRRAMRLEAVSSGKVTLGAGLPAWDQCWPNRPPHHAMGRQLNAALRWPVSEVRLWSSKFFHPLGRFPNGYSEQFYRGLGWR